MKTMNILQKLAKIGAPRADVKIERTNWGWYVRCTTRIGGYYDFEMTEQVHDPAHTMTEAEVNNAFVDSERVTFETKPYHDESDLMRDYCAWSFHRKIKDLDWCAENAKTLVRI